MSFNSGQSRLIELPPRVSKDDDSIGSFFESALEDDFGLGDDMGHSVLRPDDIFFHYKIIAFLGKGGMSDVYIAQHLDEQGQPTDSKPVALKILRENQHSDISLLELLEREAEICHALDSPHVVRIYEYGLSETGQAFMALELLKGEELFERRKRKKVIPLKELAEIGCQILMGLEAIHAQGIVHRDLKTENVFLVKRKDAQELTKIIDLGLARHIGDDPDDPLMLDTQSIWGTPHYLSPEQTRSPDVDHRSDLYSLGIILYECATGAYPFDGETPYAIMLAHQETRPPQMPSTLDYELCEIIQKALAKRPEARWQSATEMRLALESWIDHTSWDNVLPGFYDPEGVTFGAQDGLFSNILTDSKPHDLLDSGDKLPTVPDELRSASLHHTPMLSDNFAAAQAALKQGPSALHDELFGPPLGSEAPKPKKATAPIPVKEESSAALPAGVLRKPKRVDPLHSSPIELAETRKPKQDIKAPVLTTELPTPATTTQFPEKQDGARTALLAMVFLGVGLVLALILLLTL